MKIYNVFERNCLYETQHCTMKIPNKNGDKASKKSVYLEVISGSLFSSERWRLSQGRRERQKDDM